jgi:hypothetical protein
MISSDGRSDPVVVTKILHLQEAVPFQPFVIITASGKSCDIPTAENLTVARLSRKILIEYDDYSAVDLSPLQVAAVELRPPSAA